MTRPRLLALLALLAAAEAQAHAPQGLDGGFLSGFTHPFLGFDHVVAMLAVGLWGACLGAPAIWLLPVVFLLVMALGGALGVAGVPLPAVEAGIAVSGIVLGLLVALAVRARPLIAALIAGAFAVFHGHAHGAELPAAANPFAHSAGFVFGTGLLHLAGITFGNLADTPRGSGAVRAGGAAIAVVGAAFLTGLA